MALNLLLRSTRRIIIDKKSIMTSASNAEKALEKLEKNPFYEKYAKKIAVLQQTSPEEFLEKLSAQQSENKNKQSNDLRNFSSPMEPKCSLEQRLESKNRKLSSILKLDLIEDKTAAEIQSIWESYHTSKDVISATIPAVQYDKLYENGKKYPIFVFPLPRSQGYEFILLQFAENCVHFTPLISYQAHKENSPECLTIVHYTELKENKDIVLMRGEFDKNILSSKEAQCLANQLQMYYIREDTSKSKLLETFTFNPDEFKHTDVISELENINL